jgi:putative transposase
MRHVCSLSHTRWECKYHVVFIPKYRWKILLGQIRGDSGGILHRLARQKEGLIEEGHIMADHVHMMMSIPPKYAVSQTVGYIKGKSAVHIARQFVGRKRDFVGENFGRRGTLYRQWVETKRRFEGIYVTRKLRTEGSSS